MTKQTKGGRRRALNPSIELPPILHAAVVAYIGPRKVAKLSQENRDKITRVCRAAADVVASLAGAAPETDFLSAPLPPLTLRLGDEPVELKVGGGGGGGSEG